MSRCATLLVFLLFMKQAMAQCPSNVDFEDGTFSNWQCFAGQIDAAGVVQLGPAGSPLADRHQIIMKGSLVQLDKYGKFPISCPKGGKYGLKLGNEGIGAQAERVSYTFTVPVGINDYNLVYYYAVVFQNPGHTAVWQPRFTAKIFDVASNEYIDCSSFDYIAAPGLPGFFLSDVQAPNGVVDVYYKPWSRVTIKLKGYEGRMIRLEFTTNDCAELGHFGYAYIDVDTQCDRPAIAGANYCQDAQSINLTGPFGYEEYYWYDQGVNNLLASTNVFTISPPPPSGTVYGLIVKHQAGNCVDTLFSEATFVNAPMNLNIPDPVAFCIPGSTDLTAPWVTAGSSPALSLSYFMDASQSVFVPRPDILTSAGTYYIHAVNDVGCEALKPANVIFSDIPQFTVIDPPMTYFPNTTNLTLSSIVSPQQSGITYSYWRDEAGTLPLSNPQAVGIAGTYYIKASNIFGCYSIQPVKVVIGVSPPPNAFTPNGDGIHDRWIIPGLQLHPQCFVEIFNRWGQPVFRSTGYNTPWDGKLNNKLLPIGTYYYIIRLSAGQGTLSGYVELFY
jgi:gliding motility-associated-like protein